MNVFERNAMWQAWNELNAINARDGAPSGVAQEYFDQVIADLEKCLGEKYTKPWHPSFVDKAEAQQG